MEISTVWTAWPLVGPCQLTPLVGGINKSVWRVHAADEKSYVMCIFLDPPHEARIRYEQQLLRALAQKNLPFLVPELLLASHGDVIVHFENEQGTPAFAFIYPFLPGEMSRSAECINASQAGHALALLDQALVSLPKIVAAAPLEFKHSLPFGEFAKRYPLMPDPLVAVQELPLEREQCQHLSTILTHILGSIEDLYTRLPQQLVHRDVDPSNILFDVQGVTAILDFEFAAVDLRVLDLCVSLSWWPVSRMGTGTEWEIFDALGSSYMAVFPLEDHELLALPEVMQLRDAASLMAHIGRYRAGELSVSKIQQRVQHSLWRDAWLSAHRETLLEHALSWR